MQDFTLNYKYKRTHSAMFMTTDNGIDRLGLSKEDNYTLFITDL